MSLSAGSSLSHYRLEAPIGEGGMGVVWRAHDTTLGRDVAIKVLPDLFATDPERLARFDREARVLASLNHPHVASIYGFHTADGVRFLAMELVEGEDLAQRLFAGPIPASEALLLASHIAQALEHAHEKGVVHRDLKPANVKLTAAGSAKVLDFGLAKALEGDTGRPSGSAVLSQSPTLTGMTGANVLLGTAAYMAPEQARGQITDKRADIWAFGVVLLEMLTGRRVFEGETISDTLASVLKTDPDWSRLPADLPARVRTLLRRCLERDPRKRLRDIGEARILLEEVLAGVGAEPEGASGSAAVPAGARRGMAGLWFAVAGLALGALVTWTVTGGGKSAAPQPAVKFRIPNAEGGTNAAPITSPAIAPDGSAVAFLNGGQLWIRKLSEMDPRPIKVDPGAGHLFWAPDGKHVGYLAGSRILKVAVEGGEKQVIADTRGPFTGGAGAAWGEDGTIVFSRGDSLGLMTVPAIGGDPRQLLKPDSAETDLHEPCILPNGRGIVFLSHRRGSSANTLGLLVGGKRKVLIALEGQTLANPVYSSTGHILFRRAPNNPGIWALPFSLSRLEGTGEPFLVVAGGVNPSVTRAGWLSYLEGNAAGLKQLVSLGRDGKVIVTIGSPHPRMGGAVGLSRDGARVVVEATEADNQDLWIHEPERGTRTRLTFDAGNEASPAWSPDGQRIAYHSTAPNCAGTECIRILARASNGTGAADTLAHGVAPAFSPDGRYLTYVSLQGSGANWNLMAVPLDGERTPFEVVRGNPRVVTGQVRPGGDLVAYGSFDTGEWQVYLTRFPSGEGRWQVSVAGGQSPRWNARGDRLYFVAGDDLMEVEVVGTGSPTLGVPQRLFTRQALGVGGFSFVTAFDVNGDGSRFVTLHPAGGDRIEGVAVSTNWFAEFAKKK